MRGDCWLGLVLLHAVGAAHAAAPASPNCGVMSVVALCEVLNHPLTEEHMAGLGALAPAAVVSLGEVIELARAVGVPLNAFRATADELREAHGPVIVHLNDPEHFVCVPGLDAEWVQMLDGSPPSLSVMDRSAFDARFDGICLLPAPTDRPVAPTLVSLQRHRHIPAGEAGASVTCSFPLRNTGDEDLVLRAHSSSCICTTLGHELFRIGPGQTIEVPVTVRLVPGRGRLEYVRLDANDPTCPTLFLSVSVGSVPTNVRWTPRALALVSQPGATSAHVRISGPPRMAIQVAYSMPPVADVRIVTRQAAEQQVIYTLEVDALPGLAMGRHIARVVVEPAGEGFEPFAIPLVITVPELVRPTPKRVVALDLLPGRFDTEVMLRATGDQVFRVLRAEAVELPLAVASVQEIAADTWRIELSGDLAAGRYRGHLVLTLDTAEQPVVVVPISLLVRSGRD